MYASVSPQALFWGRPPMSPIISNTSNSAVQHSSILKVRITYGQERTRRELEMRVGKWAVSLAPVPRRAEAYSDERMPFVPGHESETQSARAGLRKRQYTPKEKKKEWEIVRPMGPQSLAPLSPEEFLLHTHHLVPSLLSLPSLLGKFAITSGTGLVSSVEGSGSQGKDQ